MPETTSRYNPFTGEMQLISQGDVNTASNVGSAGIGVYKQKTDIDLEFYKLNSVNNLLTIALDGTDKIDFTVNQGNIDHGSISGLGDDDHTQYYGSGLREPDHGVLGGLADDDHTQYAKTATEDTRNPTIADDTNDGYIAGRSKWLNTSTLQEFVCVDDSAGAAVWIETTIAGVGRTYTIIEEEWTSQAEFEDYSAISDIDTSTTPGSLILDRTNTQELADLPQSGNVRGFWKLGETSGTRIDEKGSNNLDVVTGAGYATGKIGNCLTITSTQDCRKNTVSGLSFPNNSVTVAQWVKVASTGLSGEFFRVPRNWDLVCYGMGIFNGYPRLQIWDGSVVSSITGGTLLSADTWYLLVGVYTYVGSGTSKLDIYVGASSDAEQVTNAGALAAAATTFYGYRGVNAVTVDHYADEVVIWNVALSQAEVTDLYDIPFIYNSPGYTRYNFDAGSSTSWDTFTLNYTEPANTTVKIRFRSATTEGNLASASWSSYVESPGSGVETAIPASVDDNQWLQIEVNLATTDTAVTPTVTSFKVSYQETARGVTFVTLSEEARLPNETRHRDITGADLHVTKAHASYHETGGSDILSDLTLASLIATANLDIGAFNFRALSLTADGLTPGRLVRAGTAGLLEDATVTESSGALGGITTLSMNNRLTNSLADGGNSPFVITSLVKNTNLNADMVDDIHASTTATANKLLALDAQLDLHLGTGDLSCEDAAIGGEAGIGVAVSSSYGMWLYNSGSSRNLYSLRSLSGDAITGKAENGIGVRGWSTDSTVGDSGESQPGVYALGHYNEGLLAISGGQPAILSGDSFCLNLHKTNAAHFDGSTTYTDHGTEANKYKGIPFTLLADTDDRFFSAFQVCPWGKLYVDVETAGSYGTLTVEYYHDTNGWTSVDGLSDGTSGFSQDGFMAWTIPTSNWSSKTLDQVTGDTTGTGLSGYWIRLSVDAVTTPATINSIACVWKNTLILEAFLYDTNDGYIFDRQYNWKSDVTAMNDVADEAAHKFDTFAAPSTADLFHVRSAGTTKFKVDKDGNITCEDIILENGEKIVNSTNGSIEFWGVGGANDTDLKIDLDGVYPILTSTTDATIGIWETLAVVSSQGIKCYGTGQSNYFSLFHDNTNGSLTTSNSGGDIIFKPQNSESFRLKSDGEIQIPFDLVVGAAGQLSFGAGQNAYMGYATNWIFVPDNVGTGYLQISTAQPLALVIGKGTAGVDYQLKFDGETNDGLLTWMEDEDYFTVDKIRGNESFWYRAVHKNMLNAAPGASGATFIAPSAATTLGGYILSAAGHELYFGDSITSMWDGASDPTVRVTWEVNEAAAADGDVDLKLVCVYKGNHDVANKTQTLQVAHTVTGNKARYTRHTTIFTIDWDLAGNIVEEADKISFTLNCEATGDVTNVIINTVMFRYPTAKMNPEV